MPNTTQRPRPKSTQRARARLSLSPILARTAPRSSRRTAPSSVRPADPCPRPSPRGPSTRFFFLNFKLSSPSNFCPVFLRQFLYDLIKQKQTFPYNFSLTRRKKKSRSAKGGEKVSVVVLEGGEVVGRGVGCRGRGEDHGRQGGQAHQAHQALQAHQGPFDTGTRGTRDAPGEGREPLCARREDAGSTGGKGGKEGDAEGRGARGPADREAGSAAVPGAGDRGGALTRRARDTTRAPTYAVIHVGPSVDGFLPLNADEEGRAHLLFVALSVLPGGALVDGVHLDGDLLAHPGR